MIIISCLFVAVLLTIISKFPLVFAMKNAGGYDNNHPRAQAASLTGFGARAWAAHQNSYESLIVFGIACLSVLVRSKVSYLVEVLAVTHIIARCVYHFLYLMNLATLRTLVWFIGFLCSLIILGIAI